MTELDRRTFLRPSDGVLSIAVEFETKLYLAVKGRGKKEFTSQYFVHDWRVLHLGT
ncbi:MAG: hypothetical protein ACJATN_000364 [Neolewinella sp.]|jgi:hypothetical protein